MLRKIKVAALLGVAVLWLAVSAPLIAQDQIILQDGLVGWQFYGSGSRTVTMRIPAQDCSGGICYMANGQASGTGHLQGSGTYTITTPSNVPWTLTVNADGSSTVTQNAPITFTYNSSSGTLNGMLQFSTISATNNHLQSTAAAMLSVTGGSFVQLFPNGGAANFTIGTTFPLQTLWMVHGFATAEVLGGTIAPNAACQGANSPLNSQLGMAGPTNFAVLSMGGNGETLVNINLGFVTGNVGAPNTGSVQESAPSSVSGEWIVGSQVNTSGVQGQHGAIVANDSLLSQAVHDANTAATYFAGLPITQSVQQQFPSNGQITTSLTITGAPGINVVDLSNFELNNGSGTLTFTGPQGTSFVINDSGSFNLHAGNIAVSGGVGPLDVMWNITNPSASVVTMVPTTAVGILLAPDNNINSMDSSTYTGEVIGGFDKTITLMSGTHVVNPCQQ